MSKVSIYLNFQGNTEEAFNFYKSVFKTEFVGQVMRMSDVPPQPGMPPLPEKEKNTIMHIALPIGKNNMLMATDAPESMGFSLIAGTNQYICVSPDSRDEATKLFNGLSSGGNVEMELQDMFWGAYFGSCTDKFGVQWMFNCTGK